MVNGIVQFFLESKGYGYIRNPETREEFYFQEKNLLDIVKKGDRVSFILKEGRYGLFADQIKKVTKSE